MAFQTPITVKESIENVHTKKYLLPAIQREVVWGVEKIVLLFDSLMREYPIGSFLFWHVDKKNTGSYQFYEFMREYHEKDNCHNPKANVSGQDDITGILDGQQRLTSLYIGLKGSYAYREPRKRYDNPLAYPTRRLYLNLLSPKREGGQIDLYYDFAFLKEQELLENKEGKFWFKVGDILDLKEQAEVNDYLIEHDLMNRPQDQSKYANRTLFRLWKIVHDSKIINYYLEKDESLDKVLNIFVRVNSAGTPLSYSDLLLSIATAQWEHRDAREEVTSFVDELNKTGDGFNFDKDFVLKSCLVLSDFGDIAFKVDNFNKANMLKIEQRWDEITQAIRGAVTLLSGLGYSRDTLTANYALTPIAYYLNKIGLPKNFDLANKYSNDRASIQKWLILSLVKRVFGGTPDSVLRPIREVLREGGDEFPFDKIMDKFKRTNKSLVTTEDDIENMLCNRYGQGYTFSTLALLYPSFDFRNKFHIDHIHPQSHFTRARLIKRGIPEGDIDFYLENVNLLPNLQLLEGVPNQEKSDTEFVKWVETIHSTEVEKIEYMRRHFIPEVDLSIKNFREFFEERKEKMRKELQTLLGV